MSTCPKPALTVVPARDFLLAMAGVAHAENTVRSPASEAELRTLADMLTADELGTFVGAVGLLTSFVKVSAPATTKSSRSAKWRPASAAAPTPGQRERELVGWFRAAAQAAVAFNVNVPIHADVRCAAVWAKIAAGHRARGRAAWPNRVLFDNHCARARLFEGEARALREYLGVPSRRTTTKES